MVPQPSLHFPVWNGTSEAYEPGRVAPIGTPPRFLDIRRWSHGPTCMIRRLLSRVFAPRLPGRIRGDWEPPRDPWFEGERGPGLSRDFGR